MNRHRVVMDTRNGLYEPPGLTELSPNEILTPLVCRYSFNRMMDGLETSYHSKKLRAGSVANRGGASSGGWGSCRVIYVIDESRRLAVLGGRNRHPRTRRGNPWVRPRVCLPGFPEDVYPLSTGPHSLPQWRSPGRSSPGTRWIAPLSSASPAASLPTRRDQALRSECPVAPCS